jgi:hypothetical protein
MAWSRPSRRWPEFRSAPRARRGRGSDAQDPQFLGRAAPGDRPGNGPRAAEEDCGGGRPDLTVWPRWSVYPAVDSHSVAGSPAPTHCAPGHSDPSRRAGVSPSLGRVPPRRGSLTSRMARSRGVSPASGVPQTPGSVSNTPKARVSRRGDHLPHALLSGERSRQAKGRPSSTAVAPSETAVNTSAPLRMPLSSSTGARA